MLYQMPLAITQCKEFIRHARSMFLCEHCDKDAMERALVEHSKRMKRF